MVLTYDLFEDRQIDDVTFHNFCIFYYIKERDSMLLITIGPFNNRSQMTSKCGEKISDIFLVLALFDVIRNLFLNRIKGMVFHHGCHAENVTWHAKERLQRITSVKHATSENQFMFEKPLSLSKWSYLVLTSWFINHKS